MPVMMPIAGAAAGAQGSPYLAVLSFLASAITTGKVVNETNFPGIGRYLPGYVLITIDPTGAGTGSIDISTDNGTTWKVVYPVAAATGAGGLIYVDTASTVRLVITATTADVFMFPLGTL